MAFTFELRFSENFELSWLTLHPAFSVMNGRVTRVERLERGKDRRWQIHVVPAGPGNVVVTLPGTADCETTHAICAADDRPLAESVIAIIPEMPPPPPGLSVADARVEKAEGATVDFAVTLSRAASETVTVDYATSDGTAVAGSDYTAARTFGAN